MPVTVVAALVDVLVVFGVVVVVVVTDVVDMPGDTVVSVVPLSVLLVVAIYNMTYKRHAV